MLRLEGDANDYFGKGLSGGTLVLRPARTAKFVAEENVIAGNVILYGATAGNVFIRGVVGERFCVRNSGATAVVEGVGDHGCEYMTGGNAVILGPTGRNFAAGMSGGFAFVLDPDRSLFLRMNRDMVDLDVLDDEDDVVWLRSIVTQHLELTGSAVAERLLSNWCENVRMFTKIFPKDYKRVLEAQRDAVERGVDSTKQSWRPLVGETMRWFMKHDRELPKRRPIPVRIARLAGGLRRLPARQGAYPRRAVHGLRHPVLSHRLPAREPHPGVERPRVPRPVGGGVRSPARDEQLPRVHRAAVPGAVRSRVRARDQRARRSRSSRSKSRSSTGRGKTASCVRCSSTARRASGSRSWGAVRRGSAAAQQLTRAGHDVTVFERADRIGGLLRYGIPEFKMEKRHLDRRIAQMEAEGTQFQTNANVGENVPVADLQQFDAVVLAGGATAWRDLPVPGREFAGVYQAMEYLPWGNRVQQGDIEEAPISAEGKRVVIIGGGDTGADCLGTAIRQGAAEVHQFEILPRPPDARVESMPWPTYPMIYRVSSAHEEGGERVFAVNTECFLGDDDGNLRALRAHEVEQKIVDGRMTFERVEGTDFELECELVLLAMGFVGPQRPGLLEQLGVEINERGNVDPRRGVPHEPRQRVRVRRHGPRSEPHRVGHRRGPLVRGRRRRVPHGRDPAPRAHHPRHGSAALIGE